MRRIRDLSTVKQILFLAVLPAFGAWFLLCCMDVIPHRGPLPVWEALFWIILGMMFFFFWQACFAICFLVYELVRLSISFIWKKSGGHRPPLHGMGFVASQE
jgi:hypothetical protein